MTSKYDYFADNSFTRTTDGAGVDGRTVYGRLCPFNTRARVSDDGRSAYMEQFAPGAFARTIAERGHKITLLGNHDMRKFPLGRAVELVEKADGLHGSFEVAKTTEGNDALELVRSGLVSGFSVGFSGVAHRYERDKDRTMTRTEVSLREVSLTASPAYVDATVEGIRNARSPFPNLAAALARQELIRALTES